MTLPKRPLVCIIIVIAAVSVVEIRSQEMRQSGPQTRNSIALAQKASTETPTLEQREKKLQELVGVNLYACSGARFLDFRESKDPNSIPPGYKIFSNNSAVPAKTLSPLPVKKAIAFGGIPESRNVYLIVDLGGQKEGILFGHMRTSGPLLSGEKLLAELIGTEREADILTKIPESFSQESIESIRFHAYSRGMTWDELECAIGRPERVNSYGDQKQLIYTGGKLIIYLDGSGRVSDVQEFDQ
jgi:hypothetical protein